MTGQSIGRGTRKSESRLIAIDRIHILNPRARNQKVFHEIAANMAEIGMKRPITVTPCRSGAAGKDYDLVCGQGRIEAFLACGETHIPALVIDASEEQAMIMSLVENLARRQHRPLELLKGIEILQQQGYNAPAISKKVGLNESYVYDVLGLMNNGEERLLTAAVDGKILMYLALRIASGTEDEQRALHEAYEAGQLRGAKLLEAKKVLDERRIRGKRLKGGRSGPKRERRPMTGADVVKAFEDEMNRKRLLIMKAEGVSTKLMFITEALRTLLQDEHFSTLLRAENLQTLPKDLMLRIAERDGRHA
jgi:ParB family chromosome partitioning protein